MLVCSYTPALYAASYDTLCSDIYFIIASINFLTIWSAVVFFCVIGPAHNYQLAPYACDPIADLMVVLACTTLVGTDYWEQPQTHQLQVLTVALLTDISQIKQCYSLYLSVLNRRSFIQCFLLAFLLPFWGNTSM